MKLIKLLFLLLPFIAFSQKSALKKEINKITSGKNATVAVSVKGIDFPFEYSNKNADKKLPMLSVFKFHIGLAVLDLVDKGKLSLEQKIFVKKSDLQEKSDLVEIFWSPMREKYPDGNVELTLDEILKYNISLSDNNACDILLRLIGGTETVQKFLNSKGIKNFQIKYSEHQMHKRAEFLYQNYTTTKSLSQLLKLFYENKIVSKKSTDYLYKIMLETETGTNKLKEQLPKGITAHKTGSSGKIGNLTIAENDAGIITLPNGKHYAVSVFINDSAETSEVNCKMISDISKAVYDALKETR